MSEWFENYQSFREFEIQKKDFKIKIAQTPAELKATIKLRNSIYLKHSTAEKKPLSDKDDYDEIADHLIVKDQNNEVVGTYRIMVSDRNPKPYASKYFDLSPLLNLDGRKMELGRASVQESSRSGLIIQMLWRGIAEYIKQSESKYMFGTSTIWENNRTLALKINQLLTQEEKISDLELNPRSLYQLKDWDEKIKNYFGPRIKVSDLSALYRGYFKLGALFASKPSYNPDLNSIIFLSYVKISHIKDRFKKKYELL